MNTKPTTSSSSEQNSSGKIPCKKLVSFLADVGVMQQLTTEASRGNQPTALSFLPKQPGLGFKLSPGTLADTQSQAVQSNSGPASWDRGLVLDVKCDGASTTESKSMIIIIKDNSKSKQSTLTPEGIYAAVVHKVTDKKNAEAGKPDEVEIEYALTGVTDPIKRTYPGHGDGRSPLKRDAKTIRGHGFTSNELLHGFDSEALIGLPCRVVVAHRADGSGKLTAQAKLVLAPEATPAVAVATAA